MNNIFNLPEILAALLVRLQFVQQEWTNNEKNPTNQTKEKTKQTQPKPKGKPHVKV